MVVKAHREALDNIQHFWKCVMHRTVKFRTLAVVVKDMDSTIRLADRVYKYVCAWFTLRLLMPDEHPQREQDTLVSTTYLRRLAGWCFKDTRAT
jgi:hypothetical protein